MKSLTRRHQYRPTIRLITAYGVLLVAGGAMVWLSILIWFSKQVSKVLNTSFSE